MSSFIKVLTTFKPRHTSLIHPLSLPHASRRAFKSTTVVFKEKKEIREWRQFKDLTTGKFYYIDNYTGDKTFDEPHEYIPHDVQTESTMMTFLRSDRLKFHRHLPGKGYWITMATILSIVLLIDLYLWPSYKEHSIPEEERRIRDETQRRLEILKAEYLEKNKKRT